MSTSDHHHRSHPSPDELDQDPVWDLLDASPRREASPVFLQNTLRAARLAEDAGKQAARPWWKSLLSPAALGASALAACLALSLVFLPSQPEPGQSAEGNSSPVESASDFNDLGELENYLSDELLTTAAENPDLFSDQEVFAFLN